MNITDMTKQYGVSKRTLRYYEELGLIESDRNPENNWREYNQKNRERLEQILLLKATGLALADIEEILKQDCVEVIYEKLLGQLGQITQKIDELETVKGLLEDLFKVVKRQGVQNINYYELLKEQVYMERQTKEVKGMEQYTKDMIVIEFATDYLEEAHDIVAGIKEIRERVEKEASKVYPLIRIRDNVELEPCHYRIMIKEVTVKEESLTKEAHRAQLILKQLEEALLHNKDL